MTSYCLLKLIVKGLNFKKLLSSSNVEVNEEDLESKHLTHAYYNK